MKNIFMLAVALVTSIVSIAFAAPKMDGTIVYFIYLPSSAPNEFDLEGSYNWTYWPSDYSCTPGTYTICRVAIAWTDIPNYDIHDPETSFTDWLAAQNGEAGEYASATAAVNALATRRQ